MRLRYFLPGPHHRSMLTVHAAVEGEGAPSVETLPAMLPNLHIRLAGTCSYLFADGRARPAPAVSLVGPTSGAYRMVVSPDLRLAAVGFLPAGWLTLLGLPAADCADRLIGGDEIWGEAAVDRLLGQMHALPFDGRHTEALEAFLGDRAREPPSRLLRHACLVDRWLEGSRSLSVDDLARQLDVSRRQMRRATLDAYGMCPKTLSMKYRALRAAAALAVRDWADPADAPALYADQSHMIRDFRRFVGWTPSVLGRDPRLAARATIAGRWETGATRPLIILS